MASSSKPSRLLFLAAAAVLAGFVPIAAAAQESVGTIAGVVTADDTGAPLSGAQVQVGETGLGGMTNQEGRFLIVGVPAGDYQLSITYLGYRTGSVPVTVVTDETASVTAELSLDPLALDEVVVTGYGTSRKEELTGSLNVIPAEKLEMLTTTTFQDVIQGSPGVVVSSLDGAPGAGFDIRVRGQGSISASSEPLYVIDGMPLYNSASANTQVDNGGRTANALASLNPNDIESIVVLKDAASTAIYGSRGANGVVLITTKGGVAGADIMQSDPKFQVSIQSGISSFAHDNLLQPLTAEQYHDFYIETRVADGMSEADAEAQYQNQWPVREDNNWMDLMTRNGLTNQLDVSATGATSGVTYYLSVGAFQQEGNVREQFFDRYSSRLNLTAQVTDKLTLANNLNVSYTDYNGINDGSAWEAPFYLAILMPPVLPMRDEDGFWYHRHTNIMGANHPVGGLYENPKTKETTRIIDNLTATYRFNENFAFNAMLSADIYNIDDYVFENMFFGDGRNSGGWFDDSRVENRFYQGSGTLNFTDQFADRHNVDALIGYETSYSLRDRVNVWGEGFAHPDLKLGTSAAITEGTSTRSDYSFESMVTRVYDDLDRTYFLSASFRRDGSSRFGPDNRFGNFWSAGAGYTLSNASFMQDIDLIDFLKLRTSYGQVGNAGIGNFEWQGLYGFGSAYDGQPGAAPTQVANTALTWESQGSFNVGMDWAILDNRLSGTLEYYRKSSSDLLLNVPTSMTTGFSSTLKNFGDMENSGVEFSIEAEVLRGSDYGFAANFNITTQNNEITRLQEDFVDGTKIRQVGSDYQTYYLLLWAGVDPATGGPLYYTDPSRTETTSSLAEAERFADGRSATPDYLGSFGFDAHWKRFSLNAVATYMFGHYLYAGAERFFHGDGVYLPRSTSQFAWENRWRQPGDNALFPQQIWGGNSGSQPSNSDRYLYDGDYIRLKDVTLGYEVPQEWASKIRASSLSARITLTNYLTWVADEHLFFDPEQIVSGVYNTGTPNAKTVSLGLTVGF
ncbi:MAG: SusC/RagA family TonB-linked outer membrane protein [Longimicrobiales bacterium]